MASACSLRRQNPLRVARQVGRLQRRNSRAAALFQVDAEAGAQGFAHLRWSERHDGMTRSEGCYLLRSNATDWSGEEL